MKIIEQIKPCKESVNIAIVISRFNSYVVDRLYDGALKSLEANGVNTDAVTVVKVPGAFEIPVAVKTLLDQNEFDAVITLGAVIRGETPHFEFISNECTHGISELAMNSGVPIIFGVLTVDNAEQAMDRAGDEESNKGYEAASAALEMISVLEQIKS
ncbi:MAG TPA: 6,7-dimethyl-8-ribityllumazine synthase [Thiotrichaceae bacterium]|nr:6,7-dimethyl-8-ribityllumazine synthase [Thiotrichaceae bacterium]HIM08233.1 6,7-dimethyl-8-ribityllumazine synthase [Gammaproteobacteria bacterium]